MCISMYVYTHIHIYIYTYKYAYAYMSMYTIDGHIRQCPLQVEDFASMAKNKNRTNRVQNKSR